MLTQDETGGDVTEPNPTEAGGDGGDAFWLRPRRLKRDGIIGGVAAGLSAWLGIPVVAVRLLFVIAALLNGIGIFAYAALWLALPGDADDDSAMSRTRLLGAAVLASIAALLILERFDLPRSGILLPILLVGIGVALWRPNPRRHPRPPTRPDGDDHVSPPTVPEMPEPQLARRVRPPRVREPHSNLGRIALAIAFAALAVALLADRGDALDLTASRGASLLLIVLGAALIVGARFGHARSLILLAVPLAISLPVASTLDTLDVDPFTNLGERTYFVDEISKTLEPSYENGIGKLTVDLAGVKAAGETRRTEVRSAVGAVEVFVPQGMQVVVHARVGWGEILVYDFRVDPTTGSILGRTRVADEHGREIESTTTMAGEPGAGSLEIDVANGLGSIRVVRGPGVARTASDTVIRPPTTTTPTTTATTTTTTPTTTLANTTIGTR